jgi:hypothetical protein
MEHGRRQHAPGDCAAIGSAAGSLRSGAVLDGRRSTRQGGNPDQLHRLGTRRLALARSRRIRTCRPVDGSRVGRRLRGRRTAQHRTCRSRHCARIGGPAAKAGGRPLAAPVVASQPAGRHREPGPRPARRRGGFTDGRGAGLFHRRHPGFGCDRTARTTRNGVDRTRSGRRSADTRHGACRRRPCR